MDSARLTPIGAFGLERKARPGIPAHLHTGVDIARPSGNYRDEPVYPVGPGVVVSLRNDGPYAQLIVEHRLADGTKVWSVYEHVSGIVCSLGDTVCPERPLARFMNRRELNRYGWQFDHLHFELLKASPRPRPLDPRLPCCRLMTYGLTCYTKEELEARYLDPIEFLGANALKMPLFGKR
jgi:murein DD-endopeptidase MepM/ murein hydrolase activator NlpD